MPRRVLVGTVTSDRCAKTRRVEIERLVRHRKYKKTIRRRTVCHVHDEENVSALGDKVEIEESPPLSKLKRWKLIRVVEKNKEVDLTALKSARRHVAEEASKALETLAGKAPSGE